MKKLLLLLAILPMFSAQAQSGEKKLHVVNTVAEAKAYIEKYPEDKGEILTFSPQLEEETIRLFTGKNVGYTGASNGLTFKILGKKPTNGFRVSYIFFDGKKMALDAIDAIRKEILKQYKNGTAFSILANKYTMDSSKDGDLGWFTEGMMVPEFESEIKKHKLNDVFTIDIPGKKWHYVVLKTFEDKKMDELVVFRIKSDE